MSKTAVAALVVGFAAVAVRFLGLSTGETGDTEPTRSEAARPTEVRTALENRQQTGGG